jgi:beta-phosphoglucomutase
MGTRILENRSVLEYDAILFDFDGVLADTERIHFDCWMEALHPLGIQADWSVYAKYCSGIPDVKVVEYLCRTSAPPVDFEVAWARYGLKQSLFVEKTHAAPPVAPATIELLKSLRGYRLALVTASARSEIEPLLKRAGIRDCFGAVVCREDVKRNKPAPDAYLKAAEQLGVTCALVVEDSEAGAAAGAAAGFDVLRVPDAASMPGMLGERLKVQG